MVFCLTRILRTHALSDTTDNGFFSQPENSVDILYLGNCHAYSTCMPSLIRDITGKDGYVLASDDQIAETTYYYLQAALERQSPDIIVIELFPFTIYDSYITDAGSESLDLYFAASYADLPFRDRLTHIGEVAGAGHPWPFILFDLGYFHSSWDHVQSLGYSYVSADNGWREWNESTKDDLLDRPEEPLELIQTDERMEIDPEYLPYLYKLIDLAGENGAQLIFLTAPYEMKYEEAARYNTLADIAAQYGIPYLNFAKEDMLRAADLRRGDMMDANHVSESGAEKISAYLGGFINELLSE